MVGGVAMLLTIGGNAFAQNAPPAKQDATAATTRPALTDDQIKKMEAEKTAFQTATKDIRDQIMQKRQALNAELNKQTPDAATATSLQKSISDLQAQYDQKRIAHILAMKKIDPNFREGRGMMPGTGGRGMGHGRGPGMGSGMGPGMGNSPFGGASN